MNKINNKGDNGSPCLTPNVNVKDPNRTYRYGSLHMI